MTHSSNLVHLGSSEFQEAKRLQALLSERGIKLALLNNAEQCSPSRGCKVMVEVYASEGDIPEIRQVFVEQRAKAFEGLAVDPSLLDEVYDTERDKARCPACGTEFSTSLKECPDCGLVFSHE